MGIFNSNSLFLISAFIALVTISSAFPSGASIKINYQIDPDEEIPDGVLITDGLTLEDQQLEDSRGFPDQQHIEEGNTGEQHTTSSSAQSPSADAVTKGKEVGEPDEKDGHKSHKKSRTFLRFDTHAARGVERYVHEAIRQLTRKFDLQFSPDFHHEHPHHTPFQINHPPLPPPPPIVPFHRHPPPPHPHLTPLAPHPNKPVHRPPGGFLHDPSNHPSRDPSASPQIPFLPPRPPFNQNPLFPGMFPHAPPPPFPFPSFSSSNPNAPPHVPQKPSIIPGPDTPTGPEAPPSNGTNVWEILLPWWFPAHSKPPPSSTEKPQTTTEAPITLTLEADLSPDVSKNPEDQGGVSNAEYTLLPTTIAPALVEDDVTTVDVPLEGDSSASETEDNKESTHSEDEISPSSVSVGQELNGEEESVTESITEADQPTTIATESLDVSGTSESGGNDEDIQSLFPEQSNDPSFVTSDLVDDADDPVTDENDKLNGEDDLTRSTHHPDHGESIFVTTSLSGNDNDDSTTNTKTDTPQSEDTEKPDISSASINSDSDSTQSAVNTEEQRVDATPSMDDEDETQHVSLDSGDEAGSSVPSDQDQSLLDTSTENIYTPDSSFQSEIPQKADSSSDFGSPLEPEDDQSQLSITPIEASLGNRILEVNSETGENQPQFSLTDLSEPSGVTDPESVSVMKLLPPVDNTEVSEKTSTPVVLLVNNIGTEIDPYTNIASMDSASAAREDEEIFKFPSFFDTVNTPEVPEEKVVVFMSTDPPEEHDKEVDISIFASPSFFDTAVTVDDTVPKSGNSDVPSGDSKMADALAAVVKTIADDTIEPINDFLDPSPVNSEIIEENEVLKK